MDFSKELLEELMKPQEGAFVSARIEHGTCHIEGAGRGIDHLALLIGLTQNIINNSPISIDEYCDMLKHSQFDDNSLKIFTKMFGDVIGGKG